jgi:four helix bundle protein
VEEGAHGLDDHPLPDRRVSRCNNCSILKAGIRGQGEESRDQGITVKGKTSVKSYRDLEVWQKAMAMVVECYKITKQFPKDEIYGLTFQLRRAAVSIPANIAEGRERQHTREFVQHLSIAYGSLAELETHLQIAQRLNYIDIGQLD